MSLTHTEAKRRREVRACRISLMQIGGEMANICANVSQVSWTLTPRDKQNMANLYKQWDSQRKRLRKLNGD